MGTRCLLQEMRRKAGLDVRVRDGGAAEIQGEQGHLGIVYYFMIQSLRMFYIAYDLNFFDLRY